MNTQIGNFRSEIEEKFLNQISLKMKMIGQKEQVGENEL